MAAAAASRVGSAAGDIAKTVAADLPNRRVKVKRRAYGGRYQPVVTTMTVVTMVRFLNAWLGEEKRALPKVNEFYALAILGFMLSLVSDASPKLGKGMSYLVLTAVLFGGTVELWDAINRETKRAEQEPQSRPTAGSPTRQPQMQRATLYVTTGPATRSGPYYAGARVQPFNDPSRPRSRPTQLPYGSVPA